MDSLLNLNQLIELRRYVQSLTWKQSIPLRSLLAGSHNSNLRGRGMDFLEVRKYERGDDIRSIDWKVTARTGKTHSKVFSEEKERPVFIFCDLRRTMAFGSSYTLKSVIAAQMAAFCAFKVEAEGDRFGAMILNDDGFKIYPVKRGKNNQMAFLEGLIETHNTLEENILTKKESRYEGDLLVDSFKALDNLLTQDFLVLPISDFAEMREDTLKLISRIRRHNSMLAIQVLDPMELGCVSASFPITDGKARYTLNPDESDVLQAPQDDFEQLLLNYRIPHIQLESSQPFKEQIVNFRQGWNRCQMD